MIREEKTILLGDAVGVLFLERLIEPNPDRVRRLTNLIDSFNTLIKSGKESVTIRIEVDWWKVLLRYFGIYGLCP